MSSGAPISSHTPVMVEDVVKALAVQPGGRYIDCTLGGGGHAAAILENSAPGGQLLGIDADPQAIRLARTRLEPYRGSVMLVNDNFVNLQAICMKYDFFPVHGIFFDLGLSSMQLETNGRGFSFQHEAPLDMRFGPGQERTAADIVNTYAEGELADLIWKYSEETFSHQIARAIVKARPVRTTLELADIVERAVGGRRGRIHPATRTFQALRIAVNQELEYLESALKQAVDLLGYEGRLVVLSYHSLEDRIVKQFMHTEAADCICPPEIPACVCGHKARLRLVNRRVITPSLLEMQLNPRSRSAKLRAAERIIVPDDGGEAVTDEPHLSMEMKGGWWRRPVLLHKVRMLFSSA